jgi:hypothetical protein
MEQFCHSCGMPLNMPDVKVMSERYCQHCTDDDGSVKPREEIHRGIAMWLKSWQPGISEEEALKRADSYMRAMPEWAGK